MGFKAKAVKSAESFDDMYDVYYTAEAREQTDIYRERHKELGCFDIDFAPPARLCLFGLIRPTSYHDDDEHRSYVDKCVEHAIAFAKKEKRMEQDDPKVVNANYQADSGVMYYVTFDAREKVWKEKLV